MFKVELGAIGGSMPIATNIVFNSRDVSTKPRIAKQPLAIVSDLAVTENVVIAMFGMETCDSRST